MRNLLCVFAVLTVLASSTVYPDEDNVMILTDKTFDQALQDFPYMLVEFYAPWCGHCKHLIPEFAAAATHFRKKGSTVKIAKVDATVEKEIAGKYHVKGYPTIMWFENGNVHAYDGGRTESTIIDWVRFRAEPISFPLEKPELIETKVSKGNIVLVFWATDADEHFPTFSRIARKYRDYPSFHILNPEIKANMKIPENVKFSVFKGFEEPRVDFPAQGFTEDQVTTFIEKYSKPFVVTFSQVVSKRIFADRQTDALFLFRKGDAPELQKEMKAAGEALQGKILLVDADITTEFGEKAFKQFGNQVSALPMLAIIHYHQANPERYLFKDKISKDSIIGFYESYKKGGLPKYVKSEAVPVSNDGKVKIVVGDNFKSLVHDSTKDVFVFFHAPWDEHSNKFKSVWNTFAEKLASIPNLVFGSSDATLNEYEGVQITSYPALLFYPANPKTPEKYSGERTEQEIWKWLKPKLTGKFDASTISLEKGNIDL